MIKPVPPAWREYRFRNRVATGGLLLGAPLAAVIGIAVKIWMPHDAPFLVASWWYGRFCGVGPHFASYDGLARGAGRLGWRTRSRQSALNGFARTAD